MILAILIILLIVNNKIDNKIFYPPFLFNLIWFNVLALYEIVTFFNLFEIFELSTVVKIYILFAVFIFSIGGVISKVFISWNLKESNLKLSDYYVNERLSKLLMFLSVVGLLFYINKAVSIASLSPERSFFIALRYQLNYNNQTYGFLSYFVTVGIFNATHRLFILKPEKNKFKLYFSYFIAIIYCLFSTGRTYFIVLIVISVGILAIKKEISIKKIMKYIAIVFVVFTVMGLLLKKGGDVNDKVGKNVFSMLNSIFIYFLGPVSAFNNTFETIHSNYPGEHMFRFFYAFIYKSGISDVKPSLLIKPYTDVPFKMNVYTIFYDYIADFGKIGSLIIIFFISFFHTLIYEIAVYKKIFFIYMAAVAYYPLFMSFFQEQYFSLMSTWLQYFFLSLITFYLYKIKD